jgi:hypothetical protein
MTERNCATIATLRAEMDKLNMKLAAVETARMAKKMWDQKLERLKRYIEDFLDQDRGTVGFTAGSAVFGTYREASGYPRVDPLNIPD